MRFGVHAVMFGLLGSTSVVAQSPGDFVNSGAGCPQPLPPQVALIGLPDVGTTSTLMMVSGQGDVTAAAAMFGIALANLPLDGLGAAGCSLLVSPDATVPVVVTPIFPGFETASLDLAIPLDPGLAGQAFHVQGAFASPSANALGVALTDLGTILIGDPNGIGGAPPAFATPDGVHDAELDLWNQVTVAMPLEGATCPSTTGSTLWMPVTLAQQKSITGFQVVGLRIYPAQGPGQETGFLPLGDACWRVAIWKATATQTALEVATANPAAGTHANGTAARVAQGYLGNPVGAIHPIWLAELAVEVAPIVLTPGSYIVSLQGDFGSSVGRIQTSALPDDVWRTAQGQLLSPGTALVDILAQ